MIVLNTANRSLQYLLGGAVTTNQLPFVCNYVNTTREGRNHPNSANGTSNNATAVTILAAPAAGEKRNVQSLSIYNADTASATMTIRLNDNGTMRNMVVVILAVGDMLIYTSSAGWFVLDSNGQIKSIASSAAATQAEQETASATNVYVSPGRQQFHPGHPKAWGFVTMTGGVPTLAASYNITSITDTGVGVITVTIATDFSSASYSVPLGKNFGSILSFTEADSQLAGSFALSTYTAAAVLTDDYTAISFTCHGDQA